jgi:two-component system, cell cycle sensor histidine kinase and response regulator CckA
VHGYFVLTACDGEEALEVSRQFTGTIHLLLSDVIMPNIDGVALREQILVERPDIDVVFMSGMVEALPGGVRLLRKPFQMAVLWHCIRELLST